MSDLRFGVEQEMQLKMKPELELWSALTPAEQRVLGVLFHKYVGQWFSSLLPSDVWAKEGLSGAEAKLAFATLQNKQWINSAYRSWGERSYYIPEYHLATLTVAYKGRVGCKVEPMISSVRRVMKEGKPHIAGELLHLLAWIRREGLPITAKGTIHKRNIQKLSTLTILSHADFEQLEMTYDHMNLYSEDLVILLDLLLSLNLIEKTNEGFQIRKNLVQQWIKLPWSIMHREIFRVCMNRYGASSAEQQHFRYQLALFTSGINTWCRIRNGEGDERIESWLHALAGWGFGEVGEIGDDENRELAYRWLVDPVELLNLGSDCVDKPDEKRSGGFYVQPDFEVMVPPNVSPEICWTLENYSERITRDQMSIYRLTKERIEKAVANGVKGEVIANFLEAHGQGDVPEHVLAVLRDWARESESMLNNNSSLPPFLLDHSDIQDISKEMEMSSPWFYDPEVSGFIQVPQLMQGMKSGGQDESNVVHHHEKTAWNKRKLNVPETWHREWRMYHLSTARQIAVQAIEWQVKLGIKKGDTTFVLIPHQVEGHEHWTLEGWCVLDSDELSSLTEWRTFKLENDDSVRLILPDDV